MDRKSTLLFMKIRIMYLKFHPSQQAQNICITFVQHQPNVFDVVQML